MFPPTGRSGLIPRSASPSWPRDSSPCYPTPAAPCPASLLRLPPLYLDRPSLEEILAHDVTVEVLRDDFVVFASELGQARGIVLQRLQQADDRSTALLEHVTVVLRTQGGRDLDSPIERHVSDRAPETLQDDRRVAPLTGWRGLRVDGRHVPGDEGEDSAEEELGRPRVESDQAASFQDAKHFLNRDLRAGREDVCELTEHHVELPVSKGETLHVSLLPHDVVHFGDRRVFLGDRE